MFKVGQRVVCKVYGEGEVTDVKDEYTYGIEVSFQNVEWAYYTSEGKLWLANAEPSLSVIKE